MLRAGESAEPTTVRDLLRWFDARRRGYYIVRNIRGALDSLDLQTDPDLEAAYIDAPIRIELRPPSQPPKLSVGARELPGGPKPHASREAGARERQMPTTDPKLRISRLASANRSPLGVTVDRDIGFATTLMLTHDYSQLPVMQGDREVKGMIGWRSIGRRLALGKELRTVRDCMEPHHEVAFDASLFDAIELVVRHDCVLVRDHTKRITGIVTTADLSVQFGQLSEPFLLIAEIESRIRGCLDRAFQPAELTAVPTEPARVRAVSSAADLTFGEYQRLLEEPTRWERAGLGVDRNVFIEQLNRIRLIRNEVMHFDPDGIVEEDLLALRRFAGFFDILEAVGQST